MGKRAFLLVLLFLFSATTVGLAVENKGAESIDISGGRQGKVPFPHHQHQNRLKDCQTCHSVFAQSKGAIEQMKAQGKLKAKAVMNKQCIKCHRAEKKAGNPSGPLTCTTCHKR